MRIAVLSGGGALHAEPYLRQMLAAGWDVHVLKTMPGDWDLEGLTTHRCHWGSRRTASKLAKMGYFYHGLRCRPLLRAIAPDVVHAHYASSAGLMAWLSGYRPYVVSVRGSDLLVRGRSRIGRMILGPVFRGAALVNTVAGHMAERVRAFGVEDGRIFSLTQGVALESFPFDPAPDLFASGIRLVCTRALGSPIYDIPTILRAVAAARSDGHRVTLSLPARGERIDEFKALAREEGIAEAVTFGGGYRREQIPQIMRAHDVYVSASLSDGTSISLMEAMACGLFPVVSDIPANREWLAHEDNGLLFPTGDWQRLAELIASLPRRPAMVRRAIEANREIVEARADQTTNINRLLDRLAALA